MRSTARTVSDEMVEHIGCLGLRYDAVGSHQIQNRFCAEHGKKRVWIGVIWPGCIERRLRCSAPVVVPRNLQSGVTRGGETEYRAAYRLPVIVVSLKYIPAAVGRVQAPHIVSAGHVAGDDAAFSRGGATDGEVDLSDEWVIGERVLGVGK